MNREMLEGDVRASWISAADILSFCQIGPQVGADIEIGFGDFVVDIGGTAAAPNHLQETFEFFPLAGSKSAGVGRDFTSGFHIFDTADVIERKRQFGRIERLEDDHIMFFVAKMFECTDQRSGVVKQIGNHDHQRSALD